MHTGVSALYSLLQCNIDNIVQTMCTLHQRSGEKSIEGKLRSVGLRVQHESIRESIHRVDPTGVEHKIRRVLHWREYFVENPNDLWHVDRSDEYTVKGSRNLLFATPSRN